MRSRSWPLFDPGREEIDYLSDARRPQVRAAGGRIDPAEVGLAVELRQRVEERGCGRVGRERCRDVFAPATTITTNRSSSPAFRLAPVKMPSTPPAAST
jgi:hypothetical protein